jgi:hypothetical protein
MATEDLTADTHGFSQPGAIPTPKADGLKRLRAAWSSCCELSESTSFERYVACVIAIMFSARPPACLSPEAVGGL